MSRSVVYRSCRRKGQNLVLDFLLLNSVVPEKVTNESVLI